MMVNKFSDEQLKELYAIAREQGWDRLELSERIALGHWCKANHLDKPGVAATPVSEPVEPVQDSRADDVVSDDGAALSLVKSLKWFGADFPVEAVVSTVPESPWSSRARALREFRGQVARIAGGLTRRSALRLRRDVARAHLKPFSPAGSFEARVMPEDGLWSVLARYVGGSDE